MSTSNHPLAIPALAAFLAAPAVLAGPVQVGYLYNLSDFTGTIPYTDAHVVVDDGAGEVFTLFANEIRAFNGAGMQTWYFVVDPAEGQVVDLGVTGEGDLLLLVYATTEDGSDRTWTVERRDFRGRPKGEIAVDRASAPAGFEPNRLLLRGDSIWLASETKMAAVECSPDGGIRRSLDLAAIAGVEDKERVNTEMSGIDVAADGTIAFSVPVQFRVHVVAPDGTARSFGKAGSAAGNFGNVSGVVFDGNGNLVVSDRLRNVVMVFDEDLRFQREFGQTGSRRELLVRPSGLAFGEPGKLYISQLRNRGVAVFAMNSRQ